MDQKFLKEFTKSIQAQYPGLPLGYAKFDAKKSQGD